MAAQANLKSTAITHWDAQPIVAPTAGADGGAGLLYEVVGIAGPTTDGATTGGILRMVRVPSNAIIRRIYVVQKAATTTASFKVGFYYSDSATDGTGFLNTGLVVHDDFFNASLDTHALTAWTDTTFLNTSGYLPTDSVLPLWNATNSGLTSDPGGKFDLTMTNTATISGAATLLMRVQFVIAAV